MLQPGPTQSHMRMSDRYMGQAAFALFCSVSSHKPTIHFKSASRTNSGGLEIHVAAHTENHSSVQHARFGHAAGWWPLVSS